MPSCHPLPLIHHRLAIYIYWLYILQIPSVKLFHQRLVSFCLLFSFVNIYLQPMHSQCIHSEKYMHLHPTLLIHNHAQPDTAGELVYIRKITWYKRSAVQQKKEKYWVFSSFTVHYTVCSDDSICLLLYPCSHFNICYMIELHVFWAAEIQ